MKTFTIGHVEANPGEIGQGCPNRWIARRNLSYRWCIG